MRTRIVHAPAVVLYTAKAEVGHKVNVKASASAIASLLLLNVRGGQLSLKKGCS